VGKKQISPLLAPPAKNLEKSPSGPLCKILPTPMATRLAMADTVTKHFFAAFQGCRRGTFAMFMK